MKRVLVMLGVSVVLAAPLSAQSLTRQRDDIPPGHRPPPGMCRIWIDGVPPGQQPAPTDCATAVRTVPVRGRVIFGDQPTTSDRKKPKKAKKNRQTAWYERGDADSDRDSDSDRRSTRRGRTDRRDCVDANRDGRCDVVLGRDRDVCEDRNRDGVCDATGTSGRRDGTLSIPDAVGVILGRQPR